MRAIDADEYRKCLIDHMTVPWERAKYDISDDYNKGLYDAVRLLNAEPAIQPESHWIPVTERLPENEEDVLVMMSDGEFMDVGWVNSYGWWHVNSDTEERKDISAWMPLPEPFKG